MQQFCRNCFVFLFHHHHGSFDLLKVSLQTKQKTQWTHSKCQIAGHNTTSVIQRNHAQCTVYTVQARSQFGAHLGQCLWQFDYEDNGNGYDGSSKRRKCPLELYPIGFVLILPKWMYLDGASQSTKQHRMHFSYIGNIIYLFIFCVKWLHRLVFLNGFSSVLHFESSISFIFSLPCIDCNGTMLHS